MPFLFAPAGAAEFDSGLGFGTLLDGGKARLYAGPGPLKTSIIPGTYTLLATVTLGTPGAESDGGLNVVSAVVTAAGSPVSMELLTADDVAIGVLTDVCGLAGFGDVVIDDGTDGNESEVTATLTPGQSFTLTCKIPLSSATQVDNVTTRIIGGQLVVDEEGARKSLDISTVVTAIAGDIIPLDRPSFTQSATRVASNPSLLVADSGPMQEGQTVAGTGIVDGTTITGKPDGTHVTTDPAPNLSGTSVLTFGRTLVVAEYAAGGGGSAWHSAATKTANYTALITDDLVPVDASGGTVTILLPDPATMTKPIEVLNVGATGSCVIDGDGAKTITGPGVAAQTTVTIPPTVGLTLAPIGTGYRII